MWFITINKIKKPHRKLRRGFLNVPGNVLLSHASLPRSTIGAIGLNYRVRDGIGCFPHAIATGKNILEIGPNSYSRVKT